MDEHPTCCQVYYKRHGFVHYRFHQFVLASGCWIIFFPTNLRLRCYLPIVLTHPPQAVVSLLCSEAELLANFSMAEWCKTARCVLPRWTSLSSIMSRAMVKSKERSLKMAGLPVRWWRHSLPVTPLHVHSHSSQHSCGRLSGRQTFFVR